MRLSAIETVVGAHARNALAAAAFGLLAACEGAAPVAADSGIDSGADSAGDVGAADVDVAGDVAPGLDVVDDPQADGATDARADADGTSADAEQDADPSDRGDDSDAVGDSGVLPDGPVDADLGSDADLGAPIELVDVFAFENATNVLSAYVEWETTRPGHSRVDIVCDGEPVGEVRSDALAVEHAVFVMGLLPDADCVLTVATTDTAGRTATQDVAWGVDALPAAFPAMTINVPEADAPAAAWAALQPGWTLVPLANLIDRTSHFAALLDERGRVRWYRELPSFGLGSDNDARELPQGVLFGSTSERAANAPVIISWEGAQVWTAPINMHHHISVDPNDGSYLYLGRDWDCPEGPGTRSDTVERWDPVAEERTWIWYTCDHFEPPGGHVHDWDHLNTVEVFPGETHLLLSVRNQNQLWRVDPSSGDIEWRLGAGGDFAMDDADEFLHQHAPEVQPDGNILLFDNGTAGARAYSRAIELTYDAEALTAEVVWEYRHDPDIFSATMGEADRLANGNTLVTFTGRTESQPTVLVEVDAAGEVLWELETAPKWTIYRSDRVDARFGQFMPTPGDAE